MFDIKATFIFQIIYIKYFVGDNRFQKFVDFLQLSDWLIPNENPIAYLESVSLPNIQQNLEKGKSPDPNEVFPQLEELISTIQGVVLVEIFKKQESLPKTCLESKKDNLIGDVQQVLLCEKIQTRHFSFVP